MLIMQKDLLSELHLPKLDLPSLQNILSQNSARLAYLLKENECKKKSKTAQFHFKGAAESMVSGFTELDPLLATPRENAKTTNRKFICKKSLLRRDNFFNTDLRKPPRPTVVANSHTEDNDEIKCVESESSSRKCNFDSKKVSLLSFVNNKLPVTQSITPNESVLCDGDSEQKNEVKNTFSKRSENCSGCRESISPIAEVIPNDKNCSTVSDPEKNSEPVYCVISEVIGNANEAFSRADDPQGKVVETKESQLITPKKTTDITKIKGWRRKQFFVEKPTTIEYYSIAKGSLGLRKRIEIVDNCPVEPEDPGNVENAFVCDSLDEFLDREADLKIGYEIPHLYAEFGIKLTSDDIVSRPNLSEEDIKEVGTRYCVPVTLPCDVTDLADVKEETGRGVKRPNEDDTKPCKILKLEESKKQLGRRQVEKVRNVEIKREPDSVEQENVKSSDLKVVSKSNVKLMSKLIALVVYPGPFAPLHPIVQYHLNKLRSYHTKIDKNWANFAVSAVLVNDRRCKRKIVPAYCCVKIEQKPKLTKNHQANAEAVSSASNETVKRVNQTEYFKLKKCSVVIERLNSKNLPDPWCMVHNRYNCAHCGMTKPKPEKHSSQAPEKKPKERREEDIVGEAVIVSPRASFDKNVANLLAKKVRLLKYNGDTLTSIDCLKTLTPNTIEFIKLKFIKESFLTGYISVWFLKSQDSANRSRAFLTFSQTPPVENAINLKSTAISQVNLPKVLTEIMSSEDPLDSKEYAILHCNGEIWEIHGSLNIAFEKSDKNVEQIFTSVELPELKKLQDIAFDILKVKAAKWWVLDLTQKFKLIELKSGNISTVVTRKKFLETITLNLFGFIPLRMDAENRVLGAYIVQRLLPFVLIGPYYLLEAHDMILRGSSSSVPFKYFGEDNVATNYPLKFFINSVIKNLERNDRKVEGLWLYDKMFLDSTSYLEVVTRSSEGQTPNKYSIIDIEHGYSLSSLTSSSLSGATTGILRRKDGREVLKKVTVYLYFDIFDLGFVKGELQFDNSVIINHPLDWRTKMKSHKIGDWFIGIIRRRINFFPKDLVVRWFVTKHREDLRSRRPFNKLILGNTHILTKSGIFKLMEMPDEKIEELGLDKNEVRNFLARCQAIREVKELKNLSKLLKITSEEPLKMDEVLSEAIAEIKRLKTLQDMFISWKNRAGKRKLDLVAYFIRLLNSLRIRFHLKIKQIESIEPMFTKEGGGLTDEFIKKLKSCRIGRVYLKRVEKRDIARAIKMNEARLQEAEKMNELRCEILQQGVILSPISRGPPYNNLICTIPTVQIPQDPLMGLGETEEPQENILPLQSTIPLSEECSSLKFTNPRILRSSRKAIEENQAQVIKVEHVAIKSESKLTKGGGFLKLTSPDLPDNIKLFWKNWKVNKVEVV